MTRRLLRLCLLLSLAVALQPTTAQSEVPPLDNPMTDVWSDPEFVRGFLGSYTYLQDREPELNEEEREAMRDLIPVLKERPDIAMTQLEAQITPQVSAAFDFILANLYFQKGDLENAEKYYRNAVKKTPAFRRAYKNLGLVLVQAGKYPEAVRTIAKAVDLGEVDGRSFGLMGYCYYTMGNFYAADESYRQAILMQPDNRDWQVGLAQTLMETEQYRIAIALFDKLIQDDPTNPDYWLLQVNAFLGLEEPMRAAQNIEITRRMGKADLSTLNLLGDIYMNNNSPQLALDAYLAAAEMAGGKDGDKQALIRAATLLTRTTNFNEAKEMIATINAKYGKVSDDSDLTGEILGQLSEDQKMTLLNLEAKIARAEGNDDDAVRILTEIVERDTLNGEAMIELADYYAERALDLKLESEDALKAAKTEEAEAEAEELAAKGRDFWARAKTRYENAQQIDASERAASIAHAQALVRRGNYEPAVKLLARALQIRDDANIRDFMKRVERAANAS